MKNNNLRNIALSGLFISLSIVLTRYLSINYSMFGMKTLVIGFGLVPIILSGFILGPYYGMYVGALADFIGYFLFPVGGTYFPGFTLTSALAGFTPGIFKYILLEKIELLKQKALFKGIVIFIIIFIVQLFTSILNSLWLYILIKKAFIVFFIPRFIESLLITPLIFILVFMLYKLYIKIESKI